MARASSRASKSNHQLSEDTGLSLRLDGAADMVPYIWAHRGASSRAPENTMAAFELGVESGADGIELDVHLSRDGVPVVIHDETLQRTTNGHGAVGRYNLSSLRKLDAGSWFGPEWYGERIPTLEEVLSWSGSTIRINIEIKTASAGRVVLELLEAWPGNPVLISSFDHRLLAAVRRLNAEIPLGFLCDSRLWRRDLERAVHAGAESFHPRIDRLSPAMIKACRGGRLKVFPYTVDEPQVMRSLLRRGVDGWFTNEPATLY